MKPVVVESMVTAPKPLEIRACLAMDAAIEMLDWLAFWEGKG
jgi:hypothetical protein